MTALCSHTCSTGTPSSVHGAPYAVWMHRLQYMIHLLAVYGAPYAVHSLYVLPKMPWWIVAKRNVPHTRFQKHHVVWSSYHLYRVKYIVNWWRKGAKMYFVFTRGIAMVHLLAVHFLKWFTWFQYMVHLHAVYYNYCVFFFLENALQWKQCLVFLKENLLHKLCKW